MNIQYKNFDLTVGQQEIGDKWYYWAKHNGTGACCHGSPFDTASECLKSAKKAINEWHAFMDKMFAQGVA